MINVLLIAFSAAVAWAVQAYHFIAFANHRRRARAAMAFENKSDG